MFITTKKHNQIIEHKDKTINDYLSKITRLENELNQARDLKTILDKLTDKYSDLLSSGSYVTTVSHRSNELKLPDSVLQYVEDILGGKVIKQEGTKCLVVSKDGTVKTGLTKGKADKGYTYKLIRE